MFIVTQYYNDRQYEKCIQEANRLIEKYKQIVSPFGWKLVMDYYGLLIHCYVEINDTENAEKYIMLMEHDAPDYPEINNLKDLLNSK